MLYLNDPSKRPNFILWLKELLTTDKEQGKGCLNHNGKFCCLGVACDLSITHGLDVNVRTPTHYGVASIYDGRSSVLPESVGKWLGVYDPFDLRWEGVPVEHNGVPGFSAWILNDKLSLTFPEIARVIAKSYGITAEELGIESL